jgi:hypothetical protein
MPNIPEPQYECFACEQYFLRSVAIADGVPSEYCAEYCSKECYETFYAALSERAADAQSSGLVDSEGIALGSNKDVVNKVIQGLKLHKP